MFDSTWLAFAPTLPVLGLVLVSCGRIEHLPTEQEVFEAPKCTSAPERVVDTWPEHWSVELPYGRACEGFYLFEVDLSEHRGEFIWIQRLWDDSDISSRDLCDNARVRVLIFRQMSNGVWEEHNFDAYDVVGQWDERISGCQTIGVGKLGSDSTNTVTGFPFSWVDTADGVSALRVFVSGSGESEPIRLNLGVTKTP